MQATYEKLHAEVPKYKMITPSVLSDRLRVSMASSFSILYMNTAMEARLYQHLEARHVIYLVWI